MNKETKKILLIDLDDRRRDSRVKLLQHAGYIVDLRCDYSAAESLDDEGSYDLVIIAIRELPQKTILYSDNLIKANADLPVLLILDQNAFVPRGTLGRHIEDGYPLELMQTVASMLVGSTHIREISA